MALPILPAALSMIKPMLSFTKNNWKLSLVLMMAITLWYQNFSEKRFIFFIETIPSLEKRLDNIEKNYNICVDGNKELVQSIEKRNLEVEKWKTISKKLQYKLDDLEGIIKARQNDTDLAVDTILNTTTPQTCEESMELLREYRKEIKW